MSDKKRITCRCTCHHGPNIIDPCIRGLVDCLQQHGIKVLSSSCGHGRHDGDITIDPGSIVHFDGAHRLRVPKKPIISPYDEKEQRWLERGEYPGYDSNWHRRKPYPSDED